MANTRRGGKPVITIQKATDSGKEDGIEVIGKVVEKFRAGMFAIELEGGQRVLGMMAGRLRRNRIKVMNGDRVSRSCHLTTYRKAESLTGTNKLFAPPFRLWLPCKTGGNNRRRIAQI